MPRSVPEKMSAVLHHQATLSVFTPWDWVRLIGATVFRKNRSFLDEFKTVLQCNIEAVCCDRGLSLEQKQVSLFHDLSFLAFSEPESGCRINIPLVGYGPYTVERIQLTSGWLSAPYYAYGLVPEARVAPPLLVFTGTAFPTATGFLAGLMADTGPRGSVGRQLYQRGNVALQRWIHQQYQQIGRRVVCTGQSLGGAMGLLCHIHQPDKVDYFSINPPYLTDLEKKIYAQQRARLRDLDTERGEGSARLLRIATHVADPIRGLGHWLPPGTRICMHGDPEIGALEAHAKSPKVDAVPPFMTHKTGAGQKNYLWKCIKPILFMGVCILLALALPFRIVMYFFERHSQCGRKDPSACGVLAPIQAAVRGQSGPHLSSPRPLYTQASTPIEQKSRTRYVTRV